MDILLSFFVLDRFGGVSSSKQISVNDVQYVYPDLSRQCVVLANPLFINLIDYMKCECR